jgi:hypothetical protein
MGVAVGWATPIPAGVEVVEKSRLLICNFNHDYSNLSSHVICTQLKHAICSESHTFAQTKLYQILSVAYFWEQDTLFAG